jgi:hypothetical protein
MILKMKINHFGVCVSENDPFHKLLSYCPSYSNFNFELRPNAGDGRSISIQGRRIQGMADKGKKKKREKKFYC